ncbi:MAG TPA: hypothetical protein VFW73_06810 [Lacipirellulaceae bacterium]|nr:hypothetical protein [Lacipirellulaceae bacterium]
MPTKLLAATLVLFAAVAAQAVDDKPAQSANDPQLAGQINRLVSQLNDDRASERDAAEKKLSQLAGTTTAQVDHFLSTLPKETDEMPVAVRERLARIRKRVEERAAMAATAATTVTLDAQQMSFASVIAAIEKQTGNKFVDNREQQGGQSGNIHITMNVKHERFWPVVDQILDQAKLGIYSYGGKDVLSIVPRDPADRPRVGRAEYIGPFRLEITDVQAERSLRQRGQSSLKLQLEVAWEPRLRPIAITQPAADLKAATDSASQLEIAQPEASLDVEVPNGTQAAEITLPFKLPARTVKRITVLHGKLHVLVPGRQVKFRFDDLTHAAGKSQRQGGVQVTVDDVRKNNAVWEVHMRLTLDEPNGALQSHRAWVFQNLSYMVGKDGKKIENAGLETTRQTKNEVGNAYMFDLPNGIDGLTWVYETPAAIVDLPVDYEIKNIDLP